MSESGITYSHVVAGLKVGLPLAALGLLSTLFLLAKNVETTGELPFAKVDLEQRARAQQVTSPYFSGKTSEGHLIAFTAENIRPDPESPKRVVASKLDARVDLANGSNVTFSSEKGTVDQMVQEAVLSGNVLIFTSTGYTVQTSELITSMRELSARSKGTVRADGPMGAFTSGQLLIETNKAGDDTYLFFTKGVNLIYHPER